MKLVKALAKLSKGKPVKYGTTVYQLDRRAEVLWIHDLKTGLTTHSKQFQFNVQDMFNDNFEVSPIKFCPGCLKKE